MTMENVSFERIVQQAPDPIIFADLEGVIRVWNAAAEAMFGHTAPEALGQTLDLIIPERFREQHWTGYDRALAARDTKYRGQVLTTRSMRKDGTTMYLELSFAIITGDDGASIGAMAQARDVTERFERERAARAQARATEQAQPAEQPAS
jgi:PAS domain S-box-containing protein